MTQQPSIALTNGDGNYGDGTLEVAKSTSSEDTIFNDPIIETVVKTSVHDFKPKDKKQAKTNGKSNSAPFVLYYWIIECYLPCLLDRSFRLRSFIQITPKLMRDGNFAHLHNRGKSVSVINAFSIEQYVLLLFSIQMAIDATLCLTFVVRVRYSVEICMHLFIYK